MKINFQSKAFWKIASSVMLVTIFFTFNQCVVQQYNAPATSNSQVVNDTPTPSTGDPVIDSGTPPSGGSGEFQETGATEVARIVTDVGLKDFEEIYMTMSVLTGVDSNENNVKNLFNTLNTQLPTDNSVKNFMTSQQIAIIKLSSEFCHRAFSSSSIYNNFFNNFNIGLTPAQGLDANGKNIMINDFISRFWGYNVQPQGVQDEAVAEMSALIDDLLTGENMNSTSTTRKVAKGVCTSLLSSAPVIMF